MARFAPICGFRHCFVAAAVLVCIIFFCLPSTTTAKPTAMKSILEEAIKKTKMEQQQQQQNEQQHEQYEKQYEEAGSVESRLKRSVRRSTTNGCARPSNVDDMFQQINSQLDSDEFLKNVYSSYSSFPAGFDPNENTTCPSSLTTEPSDPLSHRSLCPYYFRPLVLPQGYYPASLHSARCKCQRCVQNNGYGCEPIKTSVAVLKPSGCFQGLIKYKEVRVDVNTGCVCATSGNAQSSDPTTTTTATTSAPSPTTTSWHVV